MCLFIPLHLCHLEKWFPAGTALGIITGNFFTFKCLAIEHQAITQITVVGNGHGPAARFLFVLGKIFPQVLRVLAIESTIRRRLAGLVCTIRQDDNAMKIVPFGGRCPLVTSHGGKTAGLVVAISNLDKILPDTARCFVAAEGVLHGNGSDFDNLCKGLHTSIRA